MQPACNPPTYCAASEARRQKSTTSVALKIESRLFLRTCYFRFPSERQPVGWWKRPRLPELSRTSSRM